MRACLLRGSDARHPNNVAATTALDPCRPGAIVSGSHLGPCRCAVVQSSQSPCAANGERRGRPVRPDAATGERQAGSVGRVDERRAIVRDQRHGAGGRTPQVESAVADVSPAHRQLFAAEHQHGHRHARRVALPAVAGRPRRSAHGQPGDRGPAHPLPSRRLPARVRAAALSEVRPVGGSAADAERIQRRLPPGVHGRPPASGGAESRVAGLFSGYLVRRHHGDRQHRIPRRPLDRLGRQRDHGGREAS